ncbi:HdeD family acid-resistance protein [Nostoc sp. UIC 10890]
MMVDIPPETQATIRKSTGWIIVLSIILIILGIIAMLMPVVATIVSVSVFGWFFVIAGIVRIIKSFQSKPIRGFWLSLLVGILYIIAGVILLGNLLAGALTLTLVLATIFIVEGIFEIIACFKARTGGNLSWLVLMDGMITLILGIFIWSSWPNNSFWLIGLYVGISFIFSGISLLSIATATRKAVT